MQELNKTLGLLRPFFRGLPIIVVFMAGAWMLAERYLRYATPMYESTAKIKLADPQQGSPSSNLYKDFDVFSHTNKIGAEVEMLKSRVLISKALKNIDLDISISRVGKIRKTELYHRSPVKCIVHLTDPAWYDKAFELWIRRDSLFELKGPGGKSWQGVIGQPLNTDGGVWLFSFNTTWIQSHPDLLINDRYEITVHSREKLSDQIAESLDVTSVDKDIPVLRISYKSAVPEKAADVVNAVANTYIQDYVEEKFRTADTTLGFLDQQLSSYGKMLAGSENNIETYRDEYNIINIKQETETDLRKISDLKKQMASVQMNLEAIDSLNSYMEQGKNNFLNLAPNFEAFTDLLSTEIVKKSKQLQAEKRDLLMRYTPEHEKVKVIDDKIADLAAYISESIGNTQSNLKIKYHNLALTIAESEAEFAGLPTREKNLAILERDFHLNEQIYSFLHQKRTEAEIARAAKISFHRIISHGKVSGKPVSPNSMPIRIVAGLLGLLAGITFVYGIHLLKGRVSDESHIHRNAEAPLAVVLPFLGNQAKRQAFFQRWAIQIELQGWIKKGVAITISSHIAGEGKRFLALGLAQAIAAQNRSVLILDLDGSLESPYIPEGVKYQNISNAAFLNSPAMAQVQWQQWKDEHDIVIIKNAAIQKSPVSLVAMALADLNLILIDSRKTVMSRLFETDEMIRALQLPNVQLAYNRAGYNPSLIKETWRIIQNLRTGLRSLLPAGQLIAKA